MPQTTRIQPPASKKEIKELLTSWGWPIPNDEALDALCTTVPQEIKRAFGAVLNQDEGHEAQQQYLRGLIAALMDQTRQGLSALGFTELPSAQLVALGREHGTKLSGAVVKAAKSGKEGVAARRFLEQIIPPQYRRAGTTPDSVPPREGQPKQPASEMSPAPARAPDGESRPQRGTEPREYLKGRL